MTVIMYRRNVVPIMVVRHMPTVHTPAQVLSVLRRGRREVWQFESPQEARRRAIQICYDTLGVDESESFRLSVFAVRRPRVVRYGLELVTGRQQCVECSSVMEYEIYGVPLCGKHYRARRKET